MKLYSAPASPYARKVRLTALIKGLANQLEIRAADTNPGHNAEIVAQNPLSKIPVLVLDDGTSIYDSHVICEYLDSRAAAPVLFPGEGPARWRTLTLGALADGIMDAALLLVYEKRFRPEDKWHPEWVARQQAKIDAALDHLNATPPVWQRQPDYGHLALACALGYLDFRHEGKWRQGRQRLVGWLDKYSIDVPQFAETAPPPA